MVDSSPHRPPQSYLKSCGNKNKGVIIIKNFFETIYQNVVDTGISMDEFFIENAEAVLGFLIFVVFCTVLGFFAYVLVGLIYYRIKDYCDYRKAVHKINLYEVDKK